MQTEQAPISTSFHLAERRTDLAGSLHQPLDLLALADDMFVLRFSTSVFSLTLTCGSVFHTLSDPFDISKSA